VRRSMTLALGGFGRQAIEEQASRYGLPPEKLVSRAVQYYLADRDVKRAARRTPRFRREAEAPGDLELELDLDAEAWKALREESKRQGVSIERVLEHAAMYLLADLDSGRVAARILEEDGSSN
jgi:hypothetical protein